MIRDIFNHEWDCGCIGCSIAMGDVIPPGGVIAETKNFILHQELEVPIKAFLVITSKKHIKSIMQLTKEEAEELFDLVYRARIALKSIEDITDIKIIQEENASHFNMWLLPRFEWMNNIYSNSLSSIREMMGSMQTSHKTEENIMEILVVVEKVKEIVSDEIQSH
jgi:diadenosine tetraphosphate (Ap4A) HIT family hydrolase